MQVSFSGVSDRGHPAVAQALEYSGDVRAAFVASEADVSRVCCAYPHGQVSTRAD